MTDVLDLVVSLLVGTVGTVLFVAWDERRLSPEAYERAWPLSTRLAAALAFGPFALPVHFYRTRRTVRGTLAGVGATLAFLAAIVAVSFTLHAIAD
jgi:hypothetical protein